MAPTKSILITDLDNTLWDWFSAWHASFSAMLTRLEELTGVPASVLEPQIRRVHQQRGTSEYSHLLNEVPALIAAANGREPRTAFDDAEHSLHSARKAATCLYPHVLDTLLELRGRGVTIVAYTESVAYWTEWRIKHTGLDGVVDLLYSAPDHDLPQGVTFESMRTLGRDEYGLKKTIHRHVPKGALKPNRDVLVAILNDADKTPDEAIYVGDSLMKDIVMAQQANVLDVHAQYGEPQSLPEYALLQRVSHWPDRDVEREQELTVTDEVRASYTIERDFGQLLEVFAECEGEP